MKKILCLFCAVLMLTGLVGCSNSPTSKPTTPPTPKSTATITPTPTPMPTPTPTPKPEIKTTQLYDEIFMTFSGSVGKGLFSPDLDVFKTTKYKVSITKPASIIINVDFTDQTSGDVVTLVYVPKEGIDLLSVVQYSRGDRSIAVSDESHTQKVGFSTHDKNREPINMEAYSLDSLKEFMFGSNSK